MYMNLQRSLLCFLDGKKINLGGIQIFKDEPIHCISEYQRVVLCMVSAVHLHSTIH